MDWPPVLRAALAPQSTGRPPQGHEAVGELELRGHQLTADCGDWRCPHHWQVRVGLGELGSQSSRCPGPQGNLGVACHGPTCIHPAGSRATPVRWREMTSTCSSSSARKASHTCWRPCPHPRPRASAPAGEPGQGRACPRGLSGAGQCWADASLCRLSKSQGGEEEGPLSDTCSRKTLFYLIATLNESFCPN